MPAGDASGSSGAPIEDVWDARLERGARAWDCDEVDAVGLREEGGTELRSGAMIVGVFVCSML